MEKIDLKNIEKNNWAAHELMIVTVNYPFYHLSPMELVLIDREFCCLAF